MFQSAAAFNADISEWKTEKVTSMGQMFTNAGKFNADISKWKMEKVTDMSWSTFYSPDFLMLFF